MHLGSVRSIIVISRKLAAIYWSNDLSFFDDDHGGLPLTGIESDSKLCKLLLLRQFATVIKGPA